MANFAACVAFTLKAEGGYVNIKADAGGPTNMGITLAGLSDWYGRPCTAADVKALTQDVAEDIYYANYWTPICGDDLAAGLDLMVFDFAANAGPGTSARILQRIVGVAEDGEIGPLTLARAFCADTVLRARISGLARQHDAYYRSLKEFPTFGDGWLARVKASQAAAMAMTIQPAGV